MKTAIAPTVSKAGADQSQEPKAAPAKLPTLDERIATALATPERFTSFQKLIAEVAEALDHADQTGCEARARALNPKLINAAAARVEAEDAEFVAARLRNGLAALKELQRAAEDRALVEAWERDAERVRAQRDKLATELAEFYQAAVARLVALFNDIEKCDREVLRVNRDAPPGTSRRLVGVELHARQIGNFMSNDVKLLEQVRLPELVPGHGTVIAWPPAKKPMSLQLVGGPEF
jgi:hypothetical protein